MPVSARPTGPRQRGLENGTGRAAQARRGGRLRAACALGPTIARQDSARKPLHAAALSAKEHCAARQAGRAFRRRIWDRRSRVVPQTSVWPSVRRCGDPNAALSRLPAWSLRATARGRGGIAQAVGQRRSALQRPAGAQHASASKAPVQFCGGAVDAGACAIATAPAEAAHRVGERAPPPPTPPWTVGLAAARAPGFAAVRGADGATASLRLWRAGLPAFEAC
mgnify:CR=1 FL=1